MRHTCNSQAEQWRVGGSKTKAPDVLMEFGHTGHALHEAGVGCPVLPQPELGAPRWGWQVCEMPIHVSSTSNGFV